MIRIPNEIKVRVGIEQGCVYNFSPNKEIANHYFIVLNKNPKADDEIYLASFTSSKDNTLKFIEHHNLDIKTYVEIENGECPFLSRPKDTCVNCNLYRRYELQKLIELIDESNGNCDYPKTPEKLLKRIVEGVRASKMIGQAIKVAL